MPTFPLPVVPKQDFRTGGLAFGNNRGGLEHAACDLVAPAGTPVLAVADGVIWYGPSKFFDSKPDASGVRISTFELTVIHSDFIARYGEIGQMLASGVKPGATVKEGQQIASVGKQVGDTMLHFEMFSDVQSKGSLTQRGNTTYRNIPKYGNNRFNRRSDLLDPTMHLNIWIWNSDFGWGL